jgi:hypothetical protein
MRAIIPHYAGKAKKRKRSAISDQLSAFTLHKGLYKSVWVCYDIDGRGSIGERNSFVKAGF